MSLLPLLFSAWWTSLDRPHHLWDQHFGVGLHPDQLVAPNSFYRWYPSLDNKAAMDWYYHPLNELIKCSERGTSTITADKDMFKVILDVRQFKPEEITVKLVDRFVVVEASHEEKKDEHGLISRQFVRKYFLPEQVDDEKLTSNISSDGVLTITAPLKETESKSNERTIKIEFTGKPAIRTETTGGTTGSTTSGTTEGATTEGDTTNTIESGNPVSVEESHEETTGNPTQEKSEK